MLEKALDRVSGRVSQALQQRAEQRFAEMIDALILVALQRWAGNNWRTFDDSEVNCTAQLYRWLKESKRSDARFNFVHVELEYVNLTPAMLVGDEPVTTAARPDLCFTIGHVGVHVECKRLQAHGAWCRDYVQKGMARFVDSVYGAGSPLGVMVGYVQQPAPDGLLGAVNGYVETHPSMGSDHRLVATQPAPFGLRHRSHHPRNPDIPIELSHIWVGISKPAPQPAPVQA